MRYLLGIGLLLFLVGCQTANTVSYQEAVTTRRVYCSLTDTHKFAYDPRSVEEYRSKLKTLSDKQKIEYLEELVEAARDSDTLESIKDDRRHNAVRAVVCD